MFWVAFFILDHAKDLFHGGAKNPTRKILRLPRKMS